MSRSAAVVVRVLKFVTPNVYCYYGPSVRAVTADHTAQVHHPLSDVAVLPLPQSWREKKNSPIIVQHCLAPFVTSRPLGKC